MNIVILIFLTCCDTSFSLLSQKFVASEENAQLWQPGEEKRVKEERINEINGLSDQSIVFYGDSIVEQFGGTRRGKKWKSLENQPGIWDEYFTDRYGPSHVSGVAHDTTDDLLKRLENGEHAENDPSLVMVHIGTNDLDKGADKEKVVDNYKKIIEKVQKDSPTSEILLTGILPAGNGWNAGVNSVITEVNKMISSLADKPKIHFADCGDAMLKDGKVDPSLIPNGNVHPTEKGARAWAECLQQSTDKILPHAE